jgi:hypothetical protein
MATIGKYGKIIFSDQDIQFIKDNFQTMTNEQIANELGLKKTIVRTKAYELGLQKMELEYWPDEAVSYLKANYHKMGDRELCRHFAISFPKQKGWTTKHIQKKMSQLKLNRNKQNWYDIIERNRQNGSFGNPNPKKKPRKLKAIVTFRDKKYLLEPGQTKQDLFDLIISNKINPIENYANPI